jgi:hypothetical protein
LLSSPDAVRIDSARPGRAKLLYAMRRPLRTFKPIGAGCELRCATATGSSVQDVLPPTVHPVTKRPYEWLYPEPLIGDWRSLPSIPATLLACWRALIAGGDEETIEVLPAKEKPGVDLAKLRKAAFKHDPNAEYDEWIKVGMQLHDGTGGAQEGLDIWCEWSRGITRAEYPGDAVLKSHWLSFGNSPGKHVASGEALAAELPADAEDFDIIQDETPAAPDPKTEERKAHLEKLIERFVFVIWNQEYFDTERAALIGDKAIRHLLTPYMPRKNGKEVDPIDKLMRSRHKDSVEALAFHPGEKPIFSYRGRRYANTFFDNSPTPLQPSPDELEKIEWLFARIDDEFYRNWLKQMFAHIIQRPGIKIRTAPLIWSETEGNGKSTIAHTIPKLLVGTEFYEEVDQGELNSDFNDYLVGKWVIALTEFRAGTRGERAAISKKAERWIADDILAVNPKGTKGYSVPNHLVITASTNADDAAQISDNNRKWAIHKLMAPAMTEKEKFWLFEGFLNTERAPAVLRHYFLNIPITTFSPNADAPKTAARQAMVDSSRPLDLELLITAFEQCSAPLDKDVVITAEVAEYVRKNCLAKPSNDRVGKLLALPPFNGTQKKFSVGQAWYRGMVLRNKLRWLSSDGREIMEHIQGNDVDLTA